MKYNKEFTEKLKISDNIQVSLFRRIKIYYKKHPVVLLINIILIVISLTMNPVISVLLSLIALFILPNWKEKVR